MQQITVWMCGMRAIGRWLKNTPAYFTIRQERESCVTDPSRIRCVCVCAFCRSDFQLRKLTKLISKFLRSSRCPIYGARCIHFLLFGWRSCTLLSVFLLRKKGIKTPATTSDAKTCSHRSRLVKSVQMLYFTWYQSIAWYKNDCVDVNARART